LGQRKNWSRVRSGAFSPSISGLLGADSSLSGGLGSGVGILNRGLEVSVVESVSIWDSSSLVQGKNWSRIWSRSLSPCISGFLGTDSSLSGGLGSGVGILNRGLEVSVVESITIWDSSVLVQ
jgi:hypothetical protein